MSSEIEQFTTRCTQCGSEFTDKALEGKSCCPVCGTHGVPCSIADDVTIKINWHELRILGMWADNWAQKVCASDPNLAVDSSRVVGAILARIERQHPDKTPLTLAGEIRQLQDEFPSAELRRGDKIIVSGKKVQ